MPFWAGHGSTMRLAVQVDRDLVHFKQDVQLLLMAEIHQSRHAKAAPNEAKDERQTVLQRSVLCAHVLACIILQFPFLQTAHALPSAQMDVLLEFSAGMSGQLWAGAELVL